MKEAIRMVPESIYDPEFTDTSHSRSGRSRHSVLRRVKEEWGTSQWFMEFDIGKASHTIFRDQLLAIFKEELDDPKFFYSIQKVFSAGRFVGGEKGKEYVPHSILLSALLGKIYLHKLDQEVGRIRQKYEIPIVQRISSVLLKRSHMGDQENYREESNFDATQDKAALVVNRLKSIQGKATFPSLLSSSWHNRHARTDLLLRGDQTPSFAFSPSLDFGTFLNKPSSLLFAALIIEAAGLSPKNRLHGRECFHKNWAMREPFKSCKREGPLIELGEAAGSLRGSEEKGPAKKRAPFKLKNHHLIRISYARYADDLLFGIVGTVDLLIEIEKCLAHFLQSGLNLGLGSGGSRRIAAQSGVEFLGTVIREVRPKAPTPIQFLRELEKRLRVQSRIHITASHLRSAIHSKFRNLGQNIPIKELTKGMSKRRSLLDAVQLAETLERARVRSPQVNILGETVKYSIWQESSGIPFLHSSSHSTVPTDIQQAVSRSSLNAPKLKETLKGKSLRSGTQVNTRGAECGYKKEGKKDWARSLRSQFPSPLEIEVKAPIKKILRRLRDRGLISRRRPRPIHVARLTNVSDGDIVNWFVGLAISTMSYYRCCDNFHQVRTIVDYQIRWSAIFTLAHKHKSSARNIIPKYSKDLNIKEGSISLAEFPNSRELAKIGPGK
uniref:Maturase n=1 Tax=Silene conica TaxID=39875 RepID=G8E8U5_SILCO|nr:maturase [Silene conica]